MMKKINNPNFFYIGLDLNHLYAEGPTHSTGLPYNHVGRDPVSGSSASAYNINRRCTLPTPCLDDVCGCKCACFSTHWLHFAPAYIMVTYICLLYNNSIKYFLFLCCFFSSKRAEKSAATSSNCCGTGHSQTSD